jgi:hypothetical protein
VPAASVDLIWSAFRASDDATRYPYNIPEEMIAVTALHDAAELAREGYGDTALADRALALAAHVANAIKRYGIIDAPGCGGDVYAYEVDGRGRFVIYDDANLPSLLSPNAARLRSFARNVVWVDLSAHVNISSSNAPHDLMNDLLAEWNGYSVIVSFSDVIHVDWTGLGVLLSGLQRMQSGEARYPSHVTIPFIGRCSR